MKNQSTPNEAKIYKIQFSKIIVALAIAVLFFCTISIGFSCYQIFTKKILDFYDVMKYPCLMAISLLCIVLVVSILIKSQYVIDKTHLTTQFGFIKSKYEIKLITSVVLDMKSNKLTVNCGEEFFLISLNKDWNEAFVRDLISVNPTIEYSFTFSNSDKE